MTVSPNGFSQRVVWVTGASSGIGEALAVAFAGMGARVVLSSRNLSELERVAAACDASGACVDDLLVLPLDIADPAAMPAAVTAVEQALGPVDVLINNAGIGQRSMCVDTELAVYERLFEVDVMGPIALTKAVLPSMLDRGTGHIVVTSSLAGKFGVPLRTGYCMAKHAVMGFFDALRAEVAHRGVKVSTVIPGVVRTNVVANALQGDGRPIGPEEGEMTEGLDPTQVAADIVAQLADGTDEIEVASDQEVQMLGFKRSDPTAFFRTIEGMAAQQLGGGGDE